MPNSGQMPSDGDNGDFDQSSDSNDPGDIFGNNTPSTAGTSQTQGSSTGSTANTDGEMANSPDGSDAQGGMPGDRSGTVAGSDMPGSSSTTAGNSDTGGLDTSVSVSTPGLPGLEPFPSSGQQGSGSGTLGDILGGGQQQGSQQGQGSTPGSMPGQESGTPGAGTTAGTGAGDDPLATGTFGGGSGQQGDDPFGGSEAGSGTVAGNSRGEGEFPGEESGEGNGDNPFGDLASGRDQPMTQAERQAALDARLDESIAVFDGMILSEREAAQGVENANSGGGAGGGNQTGGSQQGSGSGQQGQGGDGSSPVIIASAPNSSGGGGRMPDLGRSREGEFENSNQPAFPVPEDIPSGNDDDVVARQLREAAMSEPDPELRERLWNEYRNYTGLPIPEDAESGV
tara:strand:+ start:148498 stop:149691 length:1194 start_codon:yes stop_codon:yes gene_type:complete